MSERVIYLEAKHYDNPGKNRASSIGQAIDAAIKEEVVLIGAILSGRYDPHDYLLDGVYHEIKSSAGTWLSIPSSEVEFARSELQSGRDVIYDIILQVDLKRAQFLGQAPFSAFSSMIEPSKFLTWRPLENGWVQERSYRILLSKVKPFLN